MDQRRLMKRSHTRNGRLSTEQKAWALARMVLRRAMNGYYDAAFERASKQSVSLNEPSTTAEAGERLERFASDVGQQTELLEMNDYLSALEQACGRQARAIAENLMEPSGDCAIQLSIEIRRKRDVQSNGYSHTQPRIRFSQRAIREAMKMDEQLWAAELKRVRAFTLEWLAKSA